VNFYGIDQLLITYSEYVRYLIKRWEYCGTVPHLFVEFNRD